MDTKGTEVAKVVLMQKGLPAILPVAITWLLQLWMVTSLDDEVHGALLMVQRKIISPLPRPVTAVLGFDGEVIIPVPLTNDHKPVPVVGVFPANVVVVAQIVCGGPALEVVIVPE